MTALALLSFSALAIDAKRLKMAEKFASKEKIQTVCGTIAQDFRQSVKTTFEDMSEILQDGLLSSMNESDENLLEALGFYMALTMASSPGVYIACANVAEEERMKGVLNKEEIETILKGVLFPQLLSLPSILGEKMAQVFPTLKEKIERGTSLMVQEIARQLEAAESPLHLNLNSKK